MKKLISVLCVTVFLSGCASYNYSKQGGTEAGFSGDSLECQAVAQRLAGPETKTPNSIWGTMVGTDNDPNFVRCMKSKGWSATPK